MKYGLPESAVAAIHAVLRRHAEVEGAILYGSRAKGNHKNGSDIDLALRGGADRTLNTLYKILDEIDDLFLPYTIDLSILAAIDDPSLLDPVRRVGVAFYEKDQLVPQSVAAA